jgi:hypothetical protein
MNLSPSDLVLRCYAEREQGKWQAFCLDLCLAAQADEFDDAKRKLEEMILSYVYDATVGEDREHAAYLLTRKAPLWHRAKYYVYLALQNLGMLGENVRRTFQEALPLTPTLRHA